MNDPLKTISVDGQKYPVESLSDDAKKQIANIRIVDQEIARLETLTAIAKTAKAAYSQALRGELQKVEVQ
ncbi:DUF6447 family protein [Reyranella sp.]|jgi:hypothetical protein|uniref:DUF6447 family protein n=1 Tax=Reyranella sp. TaxID=1929291 RepID=UPI000BDA8D17|nr:DUF6447 family protein [Reyranella sp.]OYY36814.1 MAG: hypothetical protein B7Y57_24245 [Rhodospirillales bacterium 35-66-84]OYZ91665.1 MAG: hypothetical protein B7Y08_24530 [Rhodospirillales bacterium 24-66-33]OZB22712.1 MAG: hypothetical protein B7X63_21680 [Rhodospirillales bacterium 39-66-50]HQS18251.1 DUF6447 family protein [Reyranella sp.]HQT09910.1 DUF6447 family protein [Reyranella sp.]